MIGSGLLREGDELPSERDLASTLDVSRETIRGAIQVLAALGMIEIAHGSRSRVTERSRWIGAPIAIGNLQNYLPEEIYRARKVVEVAVARPRRSRSSRRCWRICINWSMPRPTCTTTRSPFPDLRHRVPCLDLRGRRQPPAQDLLTDVYGYALDLRRRALLVPNAVKRSWLDHGASSRPSTRGTPRARAPPWHATSPGSTARRSSPTATRSGRRSGAERPRLPGRGRRGRPLVCPVSPNTVSFTVGSSLSMF